MACRAVFSVDPPPVRFVTLGAVEEANGLPLVVLVFDGLGKSVAIGFLARAKRLAGAALSVGVMACPTLRAMRVFFRVDLHVVPHDVAGQALIRAGPETGRVLATRSIVVHRGPEVVADHAREVELRHASQVRPGVVVALAGGA